LAIPEGYEVQVRPRSGWRPSHGISIVNARHVDCDYRGEIKVILINHGQEAFAINRGDRIAQMVVAPVVQARWTTVEKLSETARGTGGFGSTGRA
jgi:dUTP pyrophosphatase